MLEFPPWVFFPFSPRQVEQELLPSGLSQGSPDKKKKRVNPTRQLERKHGKELTSFHTICCRGDKNSVSSPPVEPCFDIPNNSPNHLLKSLILWLEKLAKKSSNQTTYLFSCQNLTIRLLSKSLGHYRIKQS